MLTQEENEMLVRTGPGTPMGELFRRFWVPALLSEELPGPDCPPVRVTLLGEQLVAFRDSAGRVGLLDRRCPHRLADLFFGRNEECGLRCAYHGWKYDAEGNCVDIPNAPEGETFKDKIRAVAYPTVEKGSVVWAYLGPAELKPELPQMEWMQMPSSHLYVSKFITDGNYAQALEGEVDSSHVSFLHRTLGNDSSFLDAVGTRGAYTMDDPAPRWVCTETEYGLMLAAQRDAGDAGWNWRVNHYMMPYAVSIATTPGFTMRCDVRVPVDDLQSYQYRVRWNPERALTESELAEYKNRGVDFPELIPGTYVPKENRGNDFLIDRDVQRRYSFSGIKSIPAQDMAVQTDQGGLIADRTLEHLVSSDSAIIALRSRLLKAARGLLEGTEPPEAHNPQAYMVRAADVVIGREADWEQELQATMSTTMPWVEETA